MKSNKKNKKIHKYVYIHICCFNNWKEIVHTFLKKMVVSKLYFAISEVRCVVLGNGDISDLIQKYSKIRVIFQSDDTSFYERKILQLLHENSQRENFYVLYLHTKGIKYNGTNKKINDWVEYMTYFNVSQFKNILKLLKYNDVVGVNLEDKPEHPVHFSGNFWWSKSKYIRTLDTKYLHNWWENPNITKKYFNVTDYNSPEFWITGGNGNYASIWNSGVNHYRQEYPKKKYVESYF